MRCSSTSYRSGIYDTVSIAAAPPPPGTASPPPPPLTVTIYPCHCRCGSWTYQGVTVPGACGNPDNDPGGNWCFPSSGGCRLANGQILSTNYMYCNIADHPEGFCLDPPPAPPRPPPPPAPAGCSNTCQYSSDGDCDDGGPGSSYSYCAFGTDGVDCGCRLTPPSPPPANQQQLPPPPSPPPPRRRRHLHPHHHRRLRRLRPGHHHHRHPHHRRRCHYHHRRHRRRRPRRCQRRRCLYRRPSHHHHRHRLHPHHHHHHHRLRPPARHRSCHRHRVHRQSHLCPAAALATSPPSITTDSLHGDSGGRRIGLPERLHAWRSRRPC